MEGFLVKSLFANPIDHWFATRKVIVLAYN